VADRHRYDKTERSRDGFVVALIAMHNDDLLISAAPNAGKCFLKAESVSAALLSLKSTIAQGIRQGMTM